MTNKIGDFFNGEYGALETKGGQILQFVNGENGKRAVIHDFSKTILTDRTNHIKSKGVWYFSEKSLPSVSLLEVKEGFKLNSNLLIRTEILDEKGEKTILSRKESLEIIEHAQLVVEGANLIRNEYGNRLFANFFFFITGFHGFHVFSGVVINIIIFFIVF